MAYAEIKIVSARILTDLERRRNVYKKKQDELGIETFDAAIRAVRHYRECACELVELEIDTVIDLDEYICHESKFRDLYNKYWHYRQEANEIIHQRCEEGS